MLLTALLAENDAGGEIAHIAGLLLTGGAASLLIAEVGRRLVRGVFRVKEEWSDGSRQATEAQTDSEIAKARAAQMERMQREINALQDKVLQLQYKNEQQAEQIEQLKSALKAKIPEFPHAWWITEVRDGETQMRDDDPTQPVHRYVYYNQAFKMLTLKIGVFWPSLIGKTHEEVFGQETAKLFYEMDEEALGSPGRECCRSGQKLHAKLPPMTVDKYISGPAMGGVAPGDSGRVTYTGVAYKPPPPPKEISKPSS